MIPVVCICASCEFEVEQPVAQPVNDGPPLEGDFWLCSMCGRVHVFSPSIMVLSGALLVPVLAAVPLTLDELDEIPPEHPMLAKRHEILRSRGLV